MTKANLSCPDCEADFKVMYDMEERMYKPRFCAFCGEEIVNEEDDINLDYEDEEDGE